MIDPFASPAIVEAKERLRKLQRQELPFRTRFALWAVRRYCPDVATLIDGKEATLGTMRAMSQKINDLQTSRETWRQRAFSAEKTINDLKPYLREAVERHNKEHGHPLWSW